MGGGPKGTLEAEVFGGSPVGVIGGALGLFQGLEAGQPCGGCPGCWPGLVLLTLEVLAGDWSGKASANEKSSVPDIVHEFFLQPLRKGTLRACHFAFKKTKQLLLYWQ